MTGLFGGGSQQTYVAPQPVQEQADAKKGATDLEKLQRKKQYGASKQNFTPDKNLLTSGDTTLSSGSLLSLGGTLG